MNLKAGQAIARTTNHPTTRLASTLTHGELLGVLDHKNAYRKRNNNTRDIAVINRQLGDAREAHLGDDETPIMAETVPLGVEEQYHPTIPKMLKKHDAMWSGKLGEINITKHTISLKPGARPFKSATYRAGPQTRELEQAEINKQLTAGVIEPAQLEWASPVLFAHKKDCKLCFCIYYRRLNEMTIKDSYPLPRMDEFIDSQESANIFNTLDAYSGYWQISIKAEDKAKTEFVCHEGTYQYSCMPFGLTNAPASFQRALDRILTKYKW